VAAEAASPDEVFETAAGVAGADEAFETFHGD